MSELSEEFDYTFDKERNRYRRSRKNTDSDYAFETASDYVMDKNKELYQRFNPDWSSPPSDTIKDILEERGENYDDFIVEANRWSGNYYIVEGIESIFDGELEMTPSVALFLSQKLGSTEDFWLKRSALYRVQQAGIRKLPKYEEPTISNEKYCDLITIDFMIQMSQGIAPKDCKVRYSKEDLASLLDKNEKIVFSKS
jgi:hypothetical protein